MNATMDSQQVAQYLADHPHFFEEHAAVLGQVKLANPLTGRAVSLQERQMEVMREKYKALELRMAELIHLAHENAAIAGRFHAWTQALLRARHDGELPEALVEGLKTQFGVPQASLRLWDVAPDYAGSWFVAGVSDDARIFAASLREPYCGSNKDFEAARWLGDTDATASTVMLPVRDGKITFGLLVLGSPDPQRFTEAMATDFLIHIGETAGAALAALR